MRNKKNHADISKNYLIEPHMNTLIPSLRIYRKTENNFSDIRFGAQYIWTADTSSLGPRSQAVGTRF